MNGLERLQELARSPARGMGEALAFRLTDAGAGRSTFEGEPDERFYNPYGTVHGGYAPALLDSAMGCALQSMLPEGRGVSTLALQVAYHRPISARTGKVTAEGSVITLGRRTAFAQATLTGPDGAILATGTATMLVTGEAS